jgi:hypothetical protein
MTGRQRDVHAHVQARLVFRSKSDGVSAFRLTAISVTDLSYLRDRACPRRVCHETHAPIVRSDDTTTHALARLSHRASICSAILVEAQPPRGRGPPKPTDLVRPGASGLTLAVGQDAGVGVAFKRAVCVVAWASASAAVAKCWGLRGRGGAMGAGRARVRSGRGRGTRGGSEAVPSIAGPAGRRSVTSAGQDDRFTGLGARAGGGTAARLWGNCFALNIIPVMTSS